MHDDASWMLSRIPIASLRSWKRVNDEFFTDYTVSMSNSCAPRPTTLAPRLSFILNIHPAEFSTLFRYSVLPAIAMKSQPDNNLIVPNLSVIFMYIDRFCRYCCRRSVYFCFPFFFFFFFQHSRYFRTFISLSLQLPSLFIRYRFLRCLCPNEIYSSGVTHATK